MSSGNYNIRELISKKRDGKSFTDDEMKFFIEAVAKKQVDDAQIGKPKFSLVLLNIGMTSFKSHSTIAYIDTVEYVLNACLICIRTIWEIN
jgi:thymidine phosphorylase